MNQDILIHAIKSELKKPELILLNQKDFDLLISEQVLGFRNSDFISHLDYKNKLFMGVPIVVTDSMKIEGAYVCRKIGDNSYENT